MRKLGLIGGGGALPATLADHCVATGRPVFVLRLTGFADETLNRFDGQDVGLAQLGTGIAALRRAGCEAVCFAGIVARPDLAKLKPDLRGLASLPGAILAARRGDDALLSFLLAEFEKEGFRVEGADEVMADLLLQSGVIGQHKPGPEHLGDIQRALAVARVVGRLDVGQGAVCRNGVVLAVEAQEGTDAMLARVQSLPEALRGAPGVWAGVLAKACKPGQNMQVDLPTIGPMTVRLARQAGLAGIVGEAGRVLVVDRSQAVALADDLGLFILGAESA